MRPAHSAREIFMRQFGEHGFPVASMRPAHSAREIFDYNDAARVAQALQ